MSKKDDTEGSVKSSIDNNESSQRLEAIKNLIFGENIQEIDREFQLIKEHIEKRKLELENLIEITHKELNTAIDNLETDLNIRITDLDTKLEENVEDLNHKKVDRKTLGNMLVAMGEKIMKD